MELRDALARAAYFKAVSWFGALVGAAFVLGGYYVELGGVPANAEVALNNATSPPVVALGALGVVVWQLTAAVAFYKSLVEAVDAALADRFDPEVVKSDILSVLDERLADMQTQLEGTRRAVEGGTPGAAGRTGTGDAAGRTGTGDATGGGTTTPTDAGATDAPGEADPTESPGGAPPTGDADDEGEFEFDG